MIMMDDNEGKIVGGSKVRTTVFAFLGFPQSWQDGSLAPCGPLTCQVAGQFRRQTLELMLYSPILHQVVSLLRRILPSPSCDCVQFCAAFGSHWDQKHSPLL